ncbi:hypothetical protein EsDP_00004487 [Epichloe bromicola]|uniref:Cell wall glycoprotein n=1 Tax=Epichloe bromicola TaxID=79588 RepID=A0ABQ0CRV2_9HYPO
MNTIKVVALAAAVASASAEGVNGLSFPNATTTGGAVYTTEVVTKLTTFCPAATTFVMGNKTYAVTTPTTLTITDCPCTIRKPVPGQDECAKKCNDEYNACRTAPDANMSFCASKLASCVGYNPFAGSGSFVAPTACSAQPTGTGTGSPPTGTAPAPGQEECAKKCNDEYSACRTAPDANMSFCASKLADCVHYNPFAGNGTFVTPTACSAQSTGGSATGTGSPPTGTAAAPGQEECAKKCNDEYSACRTAPDANMSFCASKLASCVGYNPFAGNGTFVNPTACSAQPTGANPTGTATATGSGGSGGGNATSTGTPPPTGAAGQLTPAFPALALLALGALALL